MIAVTLPSWPSVAMVVALLIGAWALIGRGPPAPACRRCGYLIVGALPERCPECGRPVRSARELSRRRPRWRWSAAALLLLAIGLGTRARSIPAATWVARAPTPCLLLVVGRTSDEAFGQLVLDEIEDRLILTDGFLAWSEFDRWSPLTRLLARSAHERLAQAGGSSKPWIWQAVLRLRREPPPALRPAPLSLPMETDPLDVVQAIRAAIQGPTHGRTGRPDPQRLLDLLSGLGVETSGLDCDPDRLSPYVDLLPCSGPGAERHVLMRVGTVPWDGIVCWFRRAPEGSWVLAAAPAPVVGPAAWRAESNDLRGHACGDELLLEQIRHVAGGTGVRVTERSLIDLRLSNPVLCTAGEIQLGPFAGHREATLHSTLTWPDANEHGGDLGRLILHISVNHVIEDRPESSRGDASCEIECTRLPGGPFREGAIRWIARPAGLRDRPDAELLPFAPMWPTTPDEVARVHGQQGCARQGTD